MCCHCQAGSLTMGAAWHRARMCSLSMCSLFNLCFHLKYANVLKNMMKKVKQKTLKTLQFVVFFTCNSSSPLLHSILIFEVKGKINNMRESRTSSNPSDCSVDKHFSLKVTIKTDSCLDKKENPYCNVLYCWHWTPAPREEIGKYGFYGGCSSALLQGLFWLQPPISGKLSNHKCLGSVIHRGTRGGKVQKPIPLESVGMRKDEEINSPFERRESELGQPLMHTPKWS